MKNLSSNPLPFFLPLLFLFALLFVVNIKTYILVVLLYGITVFFLTPLGVSETIVALLLFVLPFEKGLRDWMVSVVPPGPEAWAPGYSFYFGITLKLIFAVAAFLLFAVSGARIQPSNKKSLGILFLFLFFAAASTMISNDRGITSAGFIRLLQGGALFLLSSYYFKVIPTLRIYFQNILVSFLFFFGAIGTMQFLSGQPLGLFLEDAQGLRPFGYLTSDTGPLYRVSGFLGHPTFFGALLSLLVPVGITHWIATQGVNSRLRRTLAGSGIILGTTALIATLSRSAWLALLVCIGAIFWKLFSRGQTAVIKKLMLWSGGILVILMIFFGSQLLTRASTFSSLASLSSGRVRLDLMKQAIMITGEYPLFGTGLNLFTQAMNAHDLPPEIKGFMYPVHNTFLLFFSELGIPAGLLFLVFTAYCLLSSWKKAKQNWMYLGIWLGAVTFVVNAQFQTLFNQDPTFDFFMVYLAFLTTL